MSESLAAFRTGRSKELAQLAEDHINHEYVTYIQQLMITNSKRL